MSITRRELLAGTGAVAGAMILRGQAAPDARPNVLFIMVDEMRADAMGCAGHPIVRTPNLDRLAGRSVRFSNTYTVSPVCSPSRASAFTGRYAHVHGMTLNGTAANAGEIFLPSILKHYGYHTAISGKLHYAPMRFGFGFDQFWSFSSLDGTGPYELYDVKRDPHEEENLATSEKNKDVIARFKKQIADWRADKPAPVKIAGMATPDYAQISEEERKTLFRNAPDNQEEGAARPAGRRAQKKRG